MRYLKQTIALLSLVGLPWGSHLKAEFSDLGYQPAWPDLTYYVTPLGSGAAGVQNGTKENPFVSLNGARDSIIPKLRSGQSVRLILQPGVYREKFAFQVNPNDKAVTETPLIIEGSSAGSVEITGTRVDGFEADTWSPVEGHPNVFQREWLENIPTFVGYWANSAGAVIDGLGARREMVVLDGKMLVQRELEVHRWTDPDGKAGFYDHDKTANNKPGKYLFQGLAPTGLEILDAPYTFAVADEEETPEFFRNKIFIRLPEGKTPADYETIEVGANLGNQAHQDVLMLFRNKNNLILRNLKIRHAPTLALGKAMSFGSGENVLIEDCTFYENGGIGLSLGEYSGATLRNFTIRNTNFIRQGYNAIKPSPLENALFENVNMAFGNWRGDMGNFHGWDAAAIKTALSKNITFRHCSAIGNKTNGFWHDIDNVNITYDQCFAYGNRGIGFFFELSRENTGDDTLKNSVSAYNDVGLLLANITRPVVTNNLFVNNRNQIEVTDFHNRDPLKAKQIEYQKIHNNLLIHDAKAPSFINIRQTDGPQSTSMDRLKTLDLANNHYQASGTDSFAYNSKEFSEIYDLEGWTQYLKKNGSIESNEEGSLFSSIEFEDLDFLSTQTDLGRKVLEMGAVFPVALIQEMRAALDAEASKRKDRLKWQWPLSSKINEGSWKTVDLTSVGNNHPQKTDAIVKLVPGQYPESGPIFGVPMEIKFEDNSSIAMMSKKFVKGRDGRLLPEQVTVPINQKAKVVYLLHGASYAYAAGNYGSYEIVFADGTSFEKAIRSPGNDRNKINFDPTYVTQALVQDWWHDYQPLDNEFIRAVPIMASADSAESNPRHLYQVQLVNPHPEKVIKGLRINANPEFEGRVILFSITLGQDS